MSRTHLTLAVIFALVGNALSAGSTMAEQAIILQSTTSTANSGLYDAILLPFNEKTGIQVNVVAVGTGQAIKNAQNGDGDVLLVHAKSAEETFVADGYGVARFDVMYNDFVVVGPSDDPANLLGMNNAAAALQKIAQKRSVFVSRGDHSGTHQKELQLWKAVSLDPSASSGSWYRETGSGMGATLHIAVGMSAYTLTDRGTWISFQNKGDLRIVVAGDQALINQYGVILVNPQRHPHVKAREGQAFIDWLLGAEGQAAIAAYKLGGQQLFFPNAAGSRQ